MWRISLNSGTSAFSWLALSALLFASGACRAQAPAPLQWQGAEYFAPYTDLVGGDPVVMINQAAKDSDAVSCANNAATCAGNPVVTCEVDGPPVAGGPTSDGCTWTTTIVAGPGYSGQPVGAAGPPGGIRFLAGTPAAGSCVASTNSTSFSGTGGGAVPRTQCQGGCTYQFSGVGVSVPDGPMEGWAGSYTETAQSCNIGGGGGAQPGSNCVTGSNGTYCAQTQGSGAGQCGTVNGDQVCPGAAPAGGCVSFQDGSMACTAGSPNAPNNGTPGQAATPTTTVTVQNGDGTSTTLNYFSSATVAASSGPTATASGGQNVGNGGAGPGQCGSTADPCAVTGGSGGGGGTGSGSAADGDCSADGTGAQCGSGTGSPNPMPTYDWSSDSWSNALVSFWGAVAGSPVGQAANGISSAWPDGGSCPGAHVDLGTVNYTADFGTPFCSTWDSSAAPTLAAVMLAVWSICAVFIFLSA